MSRRYSNGDPISESPVRQSSSVSGSVGFRTDNQDVSEHPSASVSTTPHRMSLGSEGYPSWLPKRPPPPAPQSTFHSSFDRYGGAGPSDQFHFIGGRKPTPRSVRIVSLQDSDDPDGRREPTDQTRVSHPYSHHARVWTKATSAGIPPALFSSADLPPRPKFRARGLHLEILRSPSWKFRFYFYLLPLFVFVHIPLQTFLDFNAVFILLQVAKYPNPEVIGVPGSGRNWALAAAAYVACWLAWILVVFIVYELLYSFWRKWRTKRPLMHPLYFSSPAFNLVSMTSYVNFCFMHHLRYAAFSEKNNGSLRDGFAETCWFYSQNLPTVALLLPRAGLCLALLQAFGRRDPVVVAMADAGMLHRDPTFFRPDEGTLTRYARGVLFANAAWTAWRVLVLLTSWIGLWVFSGQACAGLCGPRYRWEEEQREKMVPVFSETGSEVDELPWSWRDCSRLRIQDAFEFCLTTRPSPRWGKKEIYGDEPGPSLPPVPPSPAPFEGMDKVMAAIGFPSSPPAARRGVLSDDLFESPKDEDGPELPPPLDVEEVLRRRRSRDSASVVQYPFAGRSAQVSSEDRIPFPPSPEKHSGSSSSQQKSGPIMDDDLAHEEEDEEDDEMGEEMEGDDEGADVSAGPSSGRASGSMSSLGHPITSRYPFQIHRPRGSLSPSTNSRSGYSRSTQSTGNRESTDSQASRHTGSGGGIPISSRRPQQSQGRGRTRTGTVPATSLSSSPIVFPHGTRTRTRTDSVPSQSPEPRVYESNMSDEHEYIEGEEMMAQPEPEGPQEEAEGDDVVGLLSPSSAGPSPRTSLVGHRQRGHRSRSHSNSRSNSHSGSSSSRSRTGSSISAAARSRTQSLIQTIAGASRSSVDLVQVARRTRANSSMARLEEDIPYSSDSHSHSRSGSDAMHSSQENYTFGQPSFGHPLHPLRQQVQLEREGDVPAGEVIPTVSRVASESLLRVASSAPSDPQSERTASGATERGRLHEEDASIRSGNVDPSVISSHPDISTAPASFVTDSATMEGTTDASSGRQPSELGGLSHLAETTFRPA